MHRSASEKGFAARRKLAVALAAAVCVSCSSPGGAPDELAGSARQAIVPVSGPWIGTWAAAPQSCSTSFGAQTLRQIVHASVAGSAARVQLSNAYGAGPVAVADVHIARRTSGGSIDAATDHAVAFAGQSAVTVPAGGLVVSDAIDFGVSALSDVAVSMYFPQKVVVETCHQQGTQTNYIASGDVSASATLGNAQTTASYYLLANLDVQNPDALGAVVAFGASITDGFASAQDANHRWPNFLATRLDSAGLTVGVLNEGINGNQLLVDGSGQSGLRRFERDVLAQPGVRWVIVSDDPINDLGDQRPPPSAAQLEQALSQLIASAHDAGIQVLCSTLTPFQGAAYWTAAGETGRDGYDAFVRSAASGCDAIVDQDTATHDPSQPTWFLPADDSGDHLHPSDSGRQAIADAVPLGLFTPRAPDAGKDSGSEAGTDASTLDDAPGSDSGPESDAPGYSGSPGPGGEDGAAIPDASEEAPSPRPSSPRSAGTSCAVYAGVSAARAAPVAPLALLGLAAISAWSRRRRR